jgi:hypothetical protein
MVSISQNDDPGSGGCCGDVGRLVVGTCKVKMNRSHCWGLLSGNDNPLSGSSNSFVKTSQLHFKLMNNFNVKLQ